MVSPSCCQRLYSSCRCWLFWDICPSCQDQLLTSPPLDCCYSPLASPSVRC